MSKEAVEEFFAKIPEDDNLQQKLVSILQADIDHRQETAKLAQEYGFDITAEELSEEVKKRQEEFAQRQESGELSEEELESVAGGLSFPGTFSFPSPIPGTFPFPTPRPGPIPFPKPKW
ncbi:Nif11-like leader peptide family natural product precursor [Cyanobacterium aponinum]|uniref:Bacteriocin propeptide, TIGR03798 family n=1 Tax=Cyanobacterium aponinum (strain PCC 10605) TaxID=755178 RepID=K9Z3K0_CYAAP|nr:Nif11-like leader peptide family natural product precursor [Cyanobacterium aponinum]AFZ53165.1 bacteriocin propeptide, TIGR03798 family [Cyanobacterium aponinum PCC 10605]